MEKKYSIGEIADRLGLTPQALRYFEQRGFIDIDREIENNWRSFSRADFHSILRFNFFRSCGFPLREARDKFIDSTLEETREGMIRRAEEIRQEVRWQQRIMGPWNIRRRCWTGLSTGWVSARKGVYPGFGACFIRRMTAPFSRRRCGNWLSVGRPPSLSSGPLPFGAWPGGEAAFPPRCGRGPAWDASLTGRGNSRPGCSPARSPF